MSAPVPAELAGLDLHRPWTGAAPLGARFDPFSFEERMAAYRLLAERINDGDRFGSDNRRNPLWGLAFQLQWQCRSGRLGAATPTDGRIEPDAPWGYGNYALCVVPWLGAARAGLVPDVALAGPPVPTRFRYASGGGGEPLLVPGEFVAAVDDWRRFFALVEATPPGADPEPVRLALWQAHKTCLDVVAARLSGIEAAPWPTLELTFLAGWCRMVDYLWLAAWPTDFDFMVTYGLGVLPGRLLVDGDAVGGPADLAPRVRHNVATIVRVARTPPWRHRVHLRLWKRVMRTRRARGEVVSMLDAVFNPNPANVAARRRLLRYLLLGRFG